MSDVATATSLIPAGDVGMEENRVLREQVTWGWRRTGC